MKKGTLLAITLTAVALMAGCTTSPQDRRERAYQQMQGRQLERLQESSYATDQRDIAKIRRQQEREDKLESYADRQRDLEQEVKELELKLSKQKLNRLSEEEIERTRTARERVQLELEQMRAEAERTRKGETINILH